MPRFAANLHFLYAALPPAARFGAAAADGFAAVELNFPDAAQARAAADAGVAVVLLNTPAGPSPDAWAAGARGTAALPGRGADFRNGLLQALDTAAAFGCPRIHVLAGLAPPGDAEAARTFHHNLAWAAARAADAGRALSIEALNAHDVPGYHLATQAQAHDVCAAVGAPNLGVQLDAWHVARTEGDVAAECERALPTGRVVHIQVAGQPGRHEPWHDPHTDWPALFQRIDALGYAGWIGCEYLPRHGLGWRDASLSKA